jgi:hypothetical protein
MVKRFARVLRPHAPTIAADLEPNFIDLLSCDLERLVGIRAEVHLAELESRQELEAEGQVRNETRSAAVFRDNIDQVVRLVVLLVPLFAIVC